MDLRSIVLTTFLDDATRTRLMVYAAYVGCSEAKFCRRAVEAMLTAGTVPGPGRLPRDGSRDFKARFRLDADRKAALEVFCAQHEVSLSEACARAVDAYLAEASRIHGREVLAAIRDYRERQSAEKVA